MRWLLCTLALAGCHSSNASPMQPDPEVPGADDKAIMCMSDDDCSPPPCGPCDANTVIKESMRAQTCAVNPCKSAKAFCSPERVCAVK